MLNFKLKKPGVSFNPKVRRLALAGGMLACAAGIGLYMQAGSSPAPTIAQSDTVALAQSSVVPLPVDAASVAPARAEPVASLTDAQLVSAEEVLPDEAPDETRIADVPAEPATPVLMAAIDTPAEDAAIRDDASDRSEVLPMAGCDMAAEADVLPAAMVLLTVAAPCLPNERVTIHHNGMMFTATTDASGMLSLRAPALAVQAVFIFAFANGEGAVTQVEVDTLDFYDRVVLQWKGEKGFQIHAREFGATYGEDGHVWNGAARDAVAAARGQGGFLTRLGDTEAADPLMAEVYTFPSGTVSQAGDVALSVEAEVSTANCGQEIEAQSLELRDDGDLRTRDLVLAVPDCDAIGDFMVLNNLMEDLKIAQK